jgi:hypothetical protein
MIAHHHPSGSSLDHGTNSLEDESLLWATIDKVADEDRGTRFVAETSAVVCSVTEREEELLEPCALTMHIADDVVQRHAMSMTDRYGTFMT